ncbi:hypothetical protein E2C06_20200 [Dankookia rubra]|uniref:Uncharacterized protein n=1 Tax=Dankookia rubra TaxID=1442381 RepID=A0A4R5QEA5_9PROT|nr:hypothetical protein [Dankookia rubra]TDH60821.1 hypothetical protein E2C06_20200 [Dankookia rubra]
MHREDVDQSRGVNELEPEALFCIAVLRTWVAERRPAGAASLDWREVCRQGELPENAVQAFDAFFSAVHHAMQRPLDIRCCQCPQLGVDEDDLLVLLHALQQGDVLSALVVLTDWLVKPAVMPTLQLATGLAAAARSCGLCFHSHAVTRAHSDTRSSRVERATLH